jgi:RNAse (barnase) inhibitor barstar
MTSGFFFVDSPRSFRDDQALVVRIPRHIASKKKLFAVLADKLHFPRYFGRNWDAVDECLGDLSWMPNRPIFLVHEELPFRPGGENRRIYLNVLQNIVARASNQSRVLSFVFPSDVRDQI